MEGRIEEKWEREGGRLTGMYSQKKLETEIYFDRQIKIDRD